MGTGGGWEQEKDRNRRRRMGTGGEWEQKEDANRRRRAKQDGDCTAEEGEVGALAGIVREGRGQGCVRKVRPGRAC